MKTTLYLVRHGESEGNVRNAFLGHTDWDLTQTGRRQAQLLADYFRDIRLDAVYASSLKRAMNTAAPTAAQKGLPVIPVDGLREIYAGAWEGLSFQEIHERDPERWKAFLSDMPELALPGGENLVQLQARAVAALQELLLKNEGKSILVCVHCMVFRVLHCHLAGRPIEQLAQSPRIGNASVSRIEIENGRARFATLDERRHLGELATELHLETK